MNRQYIGARYVPKFADPIAWDKANSYEALTIVTYLNNSYTSKKPVPANTEITDTEYWVVTGNYNAQVEEYRQETEKVKEDINNEKIDRENADIALQEKIDNITDSQNRKFILIGDSYGVNNPPTWKDLFVTDFPDTLFNVLGSTGFVTTNPKTFLEMLTETVNTLTEEQKKKITDVVVVGGFNDASWLKAGITTTVAIKEAILTFVNYVKNNLPNAVVRLGYAGWCTGELENASEYFSAIRAVMDVYNKTFTDKLYTIPNVNIVLTQANLMDETHFHPTSVGEQILYNTIANGLFGNGEYRRWYGWNYGVEFTSTVIDNGALQIYNNNGIGRIETSSSLIVNNKTFANTATLLTFTDVPYTGEKQMYIEALFEGTIDGVNHNGRFFGVIDPTVKTIAIFTKPGVYNGMFTISKSFDMIYPN